MRDCGSDPDGEPVLVLEHVSKTFAGQRALRDVGLRMGRGEVHALLGQNGSGKSTLIKLLAGFHQPDKGARAWLRGVPFMLGDSDAARAQIRFVHQDLALVPTLDAVENMGLGQGYRVGRGWRIRWSEERAAAREALAALGFDFDIRRPAADLTAAQRVGVAVARALRGWEDAPPAVLVLDEPTAALPADEVDVLFGLIGRVRDRGVAVLYVSHRLSEVFEIGSTVSVLRDGRRVATHPVPDLDHDGLVELITGERMAPIPAASTSRPSGGSALRTVGLSGGAIRSLDLDVRVGEIVGLAGLDGSGREGVAGLLFGTIPSTGGTVEVDDAPIGVRPDTCRRAGVAMVPSDRYASAMLEGFTVRENLSLLDLRPYWRRWRLDSSAERRDADAWMERLGITPRDTEQVIEHLSGGNQQRVLVAKWLRTDPRVLIVDNPTQGVDIAAKEALYALFDGAASAGGAVVICSNDADELARLCHRVVVLRDGWMAAELSGDELVPELIEREVLGADE